MTTTTKNPLKPKRQIDGTYRLQGVFTMRDQEGFPLDMAYELAKEKGWDIDWIEALADAARQCVFKYDALMEEIRMLEPELADTVKSLFARLMLASDGATIPDRAQDLYDRIHA